MNIHKIKLEKYHPLLCHDSLLTLGTAGSHGNEQLKIIRGKGWEDLVIQVIFHPCQVAILLPADDLLDVPWEATAVPLSICEGRITFQGFNQNRLVNATDLNYTVSKHSITVGRDEKPYTPGIVEGILNQMSTDKANILQAAQQAKQAEEAAQSSASAAQQNANAAYTSQTQAASSATAAAGSVAETSSLLRQIQDVGQQALDNITAAASALPVVQPDAAWKSVTVKADGSGYSLASLASISAAIRPTVTGNPAVCHHSVAWQLQGLKIYGKSIQCGIPSPENPLPIVNAGDSGSIVAFIHTQNLFSIENILDGLETDLWSIQYSDHAFTVTLKKQIIGNSVLLRVPIEIPVGKTVSISGNSTKITAFKLQNRNTDGSMVSNEPASTAITRKDGLSVFAICNPFGTEDVMISQGTSVTFSHVMVNYGDSVLPWEPYKGAQTFNVSTPNGLLGIPIKSGGNYTDGTGQKLLCDLKDIWSGKIVRNCFKTIFTGSRDENWNSESIVDPTLVRFSLPIADMALTPAGLCNRLPWVAAPTVNSKKECIGGNATVRRLHVIISKSRLNDETIESFKTWLSDHPLTVIYQLSAPIESVAEASAAYRALTTYDGTTVVSTPEEPAELEIQYTADSTSYLQSVINRVAALEAAQNGLS